MDQSILVRTSIVESRLCPFLVYLEMTESAESRSVWGSATTCKKNASLTCSKLLDSLHLFAFGCFSSEEQHPKATIGFQKISNAVARFVRPARVVRTSESLLDG